MPPGRGLPRPLVGAERGSACSPPPPRASHPGRGFERGSRRFLPPAFLGLHRPAQSPGPGLPGWVLAVPFPSKMCPPWLAGESGGAEPRPWGSLLAAHPAHVGLPSPRVGSGLRAAPASLRGSCPAGGGMRGQDSAWRRACPVGVGEGRRVAGWLGSLAGGGLCAGGGGPLLPGSLQRVGPLAGHRLGGEGGLGPAGQHPSLAAASWKCRAGQEPSALGSPCSASAISMSLGKGEEGDTEASRGSRTPRAVPGMGPPLGVVAQPRELPAEQAPLPTAGWRERCPWPHADGQGPVGRPRGSRWRDELGTVSLRVRPGARGGRLTHSPVLVSQTRRLLASVDAGLR